MRSISQLLRPGLPYMPNASRTKENQTLATPRWGSAVIFDSPHKTWKKTSNKSLKLARVAQREDSAFSPASLNVISAEKQQRLRQGPAALTRNEAKSMSTRLLAGESFAIFYTNVDFSFASANTLGGCIICGDFEGSIENSTPPFPDFGIRSLATNVCSSLLHVEVAAADSLFVLSEPSSRCAHLNVRLKPSI